MNLERRHLSPWSLLITVLVVLISSGAFASNDIVGPGTPSGPIQTTCVTVPVELTKGSPASLVRAYKVWIQLSSEVALCDPSLDVSITTGDWASPAHSNVMSTSLGGGAYRVEQTLLGETNCLDAAGALFIISVKATVVGTTTGTITVTPSVPSSFTTWRWRSRTSRSACAT